MSRSLSPMPRAFIAQARDVLTHCQRALLTRRPRRLPSPRLWRSFKASMYTPSSRQDGVLKLRELLESTGYVVWAVVTVADVNAFGLDDMQSQHWGTAVYFTDPEVPLDELIALSDEVRSVLQDEEPDERLKGFIDEVIEGESTVSQIVEIPENLSGSHHAMYVSLCLERAPLPDGFLRRRVVPLVIDPNVSDFGVVLDASCWPAALRELWGGTPFQLLREEGVAHAHDIPANPIAIDSLESALRDGMQGDFLIGSMHEVAGLLLEASRDQAVALLDRVASLAQEEQCDVEQRGELCRFLASFIYQGVSCERGCEVIFEHARALSMPLAELLPPLLTRDGVDEEREAMRTFEMLDAAPCSPRILLESFTALVLCLVGDRSTLKRFLDDALFHDVICKLAFYFNVLDPVEDLAGSLFDEDVTVIHVPSHIGFVVNVDNITSNDKLHELLLEALSRDVEGSTFARLRRHALDDSDTPDDLVMVESSLSLWSWAALDSTKALPNDPARYDGFSGIPNEGMPREIPEFEGERIILLGDAVVPQTWRATGFYDDVGEPLMRVKRRLSAPEVHAWLERIVSRGRLMRN